jgi:hypothetical protein
MNFVCEFDSEFHQNNIMIEHNDRRVIITIINNIVANKQV